MARYVIVTAAEKVRHNIVRFRWELREGDQQTFTVLERHDHDFVPDFTTDYATNIGRAAAEMTAIAQRIMRQGSVLDQYMDQIRADAVGFVIQPARA